MVINLLLTGTIAQAIEAHTGKKLHNLECFPDPKVPGTYAFRATFRFDDGEGFFTLDFLTIGVALHEITMQDLEDCEYTDWPPTSGKPRFFV